MQEINELKSEKQYLSEKLSEITKALKDATEKLEEQSLLCYEKLDLKDTATRDCQTTAHDIDKPLILIESENEFFQTGKAFKSELKKSYSHEFYEVLTRKESSEICDKQKMNRAKYCVNFIKALSSNEPNETVDLLSKIIATDKGTFCKAAKMYTFTGNFL